MIFNMLRFIDDLTGKFRIFVRLHISPQQIIRSDTDISAVDTGNLFLSLLCRSQNHTRLQFRSEPANLALPVVNQGCRADDQSRFLINSLLIGRKEESDNLQSFPQAHIVGQNSSKSAGVQGFQP